MRYQQEPGFVTQVRIIAALAFILGNDIDRVFNILSNNIDAALDRILDYIEEYYIGVFRPGHFRRPRFDYQMWGVYDGVINDLPRTNNAVQGCHNRFNGLVGCHHATIWKIIDILKKKEDISQVVLLHIQHGRNQPTHS